MEPLTEFARLLSKKKKIKQASIFFIISMIVFPLLFTIRTSAMYINTLKSKLVYEVTAVSATQSSYVIEGWAFINESQHYRNSTDVEGSMFLNSHQDNLVFPIEFEFYDVTYLMKLGDRRRCGDTEYFKPANECYYEYQYVKFRSVIPFDQLQDNSRYTLHLQLHAKKTNLRYSIDVFFVSANPLKTKHAGRIISIQAMIDQTYFYVNHNFVLARKTANKASSVHQELTSCSGTYGRDQYFEPYSQFFNIKQVTMVQQVSWYKVLTKQKTCSSSGLHYVEEGGINETWIPSSFIEYNGNPATIEVRKDNTPPQLVIENPTIYVGDTSFRAEDYVQAFDLEDGELVPIKGIGTVNIHKIGTYIQEFSAVDSHGLRTSKLMIVRVIAKPANTPPKITAKNHTVYQYSSFNELEGVTAFDLEEGNLTSKVIALNTIDASKIGKQDLCLYVVDNGGLDDKLCVIITVIPYPSYSASTNLRFVDRNKLFYRESIPALWQGREMILEDAIHQRTPLLSTKLH